LGGAQTILETTSQCVLSEFGPLFAYADFSKHFPSLETDDVGQEAGLGPLLRLEAILALPDLDRSCIVQPAIWRPRMLLTIASLANG